MASPIRAVTGSPAGYRFGPFEVDLRRGRLTKFGIRVRLEPKPWQLLVSLLESSGKVVARTELERQLWEQGVFVDFAHGLNVAVQKVREVLGDSADAPQFIETIPGDGYRFIAPVERVGVVEIQEASAQLSPDRSDLQRLKRDIASAVRVPEGKPHGVRRRRQYISALVAVLLLAACATGWRVLRSRAPRDIDSVAVLPFVNANSDPNIDYLSDGITEGVICALSENPRLRVMARSTVFHYKGKEQDPTQIGADLKVAAVLTGRMVQHGEQVQIHADLVNVSDGAEIWGEQYNRPMTDLFAIQQEIARDISEKLKLRLSGEQQKQGAHGSTQNSEAYDLYLRGRYFWNQRTPESLHKSIEFFERALEKDPNYALAQVGLADVYSVIPGYGTDITSLEAFRKARQAAEQALQLDDSLSEAHSAMASVLSNQRDWGAAEREFKRAIELDPRNATAHYFYGFTVLAPTGRIDEGIGELKKSLEFDPLAVIVNTNLGRLYFWQRQYDRALDQYRRTLEIEPNFGYTHVRIIELCESRGMYQQAIDESRSIIAPLPALPGVTRDSSEFLRRGYAAGARGYWQARLDLAKTVSKQKWGVNVALIYAHLGQMDTAFEWLEKGVDEYDQGATWMNPNPAFDIMRSDPRFAALVRKMGLEPIPLPKSQ